MKNEYWASSKSIRVSPAPVALREKGYWIEFNPSVGMFRANSSGRMPLEVMGYSPHRKALIKSVMKVAQ